MLKDYEDHLAALGLDEDAAKEAANLLKRADYSLDPTVHLDAAVAARALTATSWIHAYQMKRDLGQTRSWSR